MSDWPTSTSRRCTSDTRPTSIVSRCTLSGNEALAEDIAAETFTRALKSDHELQTLDRARRRLQGYPYLLKFALIFSALSFGRIVSDTSWDVSPRNFIVTASIAAAFWIAYLYSLWRIRARILIVPGKR